MVEVIEVGFVVALVWLLTYGMSATETEERLEKEQAERVSPRISRDEQRSSLSCYSMSPSSRTVWECSKEVRTWIVATICCHYAQ